MLKVVSLILAVTVPLITSEVAQPCDESVCLLPACRCASTKIPGDLQPSQIPQFVFLTFDDAVTAQNWESYSSVFYNRSNPDGCPISTTYFVAHEYTDYSKVHDLYIHNHEIALHSITHSPYTDYWRQISLDNLTHEFGDEKTLISHFASIPEDAMQGMRLPFLQLSGDNSFLAAKEIGLTYDCSWPTQDFMNTGLWPYTLDYKSIQDCPIEPCPTSSIPGLWVVPMLMWTDNAGIVCSMVDACVNIPTNEDEILQWYIDNFNRQYTTNRAPFGFYLHAAFFSEGENHLSAYRKFVDYLQTLKDVYIVNISTALKWIQNPVPLGSPNWPSCPQVQTAQCPAATACNLRKGDEERYMTICGYGCPSTYPWLDNPLGQLQ